MHARIEQLLAFEDQSVCDAEVRQHVDACIDCSRELNRLRGVRISLKSMPMHRAPALDFNALQVKAAQGSHVEWRTARVAALAAVSTLAVVMLTTFTSRPPMQSEIASSQPLQVPAEVVAQADRQSTQHSSIATLVNYSQYLDRTLGEMPKRPTAERAATSATIDSLQEHIEWLDFQLSVARDVGLNSSQSAELWENRVRLMNSLVAVRYAEAQRVAML